MRTLFLLTTFLISTVTFAQGSKLSLFEQLVGKTWKAEGNWGNGMKFVQETTFKYDLQKTIVIAESIGFVDKAQTKLGPRNHGVRQFDAQSETIKFWEFDVFGRVTEGIVFAEGKNIIYQYQYGTTVVTDMWEYVDEKTYNFKVGSYVDGEWKQVFLSTQFVLQEK
jgi:hypothetical protein